MFFTEKLVPGCSFTCEVGDTCGGKLSGSEGSFDATEPWTLT